MLLRDVIIGVVGMALGSGMVYVARLPKVPTIIKPFVTSWWIRDKGINQTIALTFGIATIISGVIFVYQGLTLHKIFPVP